MRSPAADNECREITPGRSANPSRADNTHLNDCVLIGFSSLRQGNGLVSNTAAARRQNLPNLSCQVVAAPPDEQFCQQLEMLDLQMR